MPAARLIQCRRCCFCLQQCGLRELRALAPLGGVAGGDTPLWCCRDVTACSDRLEADGLARRDAPAVVEAAGLLRERMGLI